MSADLIQRIRENVPQILRELPVWLLHSADKTPIYADGANRCGALDSPEDRSRLVTFEEAAEALGKITRASGLGIALGEVPGEEIQLCGADYDGCYNGEDLEARVLEILPAANSYAERSPSGHGLHILGIGDIGTLKVSGAELYSHGRYFTMTGQRINGAHLADISDAAALTRKLFAPESAETESCAPSRDLLLDAIKRAGLYVRPGKSGKHLVTCPWAARHTPDGSGSRNTSSTEAAYFEPGSLIGERHFAGGYFKCQHAHCADRGLRELREYLGLTKTSEKAGFEAVRLDAISDAPRLCVVQHVIERETVAAMVGVPNGGKTALAIDMSLHVAAGEPWFGLKVAPGATVYVAAEAPGSVIMRAKAAAARKFGGKALPFYVVSASPLIGDDDRHVAETDRLIATLNTVTESTGTAVVLVVIDTLASCLGTGDENAAGMVLLVASAKRIAAETGAAVLIVHHPSKADVNGLRGHGSLAAACDTILAIAIDERVKLRTATLTKSRDFATGVQIVYELEPVMLEQRDQFGDPRTTIIVQPSTQPAPRRQPKGAAQQMLLAELERRYRTGETGWDLMSIRRFCKELGIHRNSHGRAMAALRMGGFLQGGDAQLTLADPPERTP